MILKNPHLKTINRRVVPFCTSLVSQTSEVGHDFESQK
jgi:hypothetical protein